jgi:hypothetical protein
VTSQSTCANVGPVSRGWPKGRPVRASWTLARRGTWYPEYDSGNDQYVDANDRVRMRFEKLQIQY